MTDKLHKGVLLISPLIFRLLTLLAAVQSYAEDQRRHLNNIKDIDKTKYVQDKENSQRIKPNLV